MLTAHELASTDSAYQTWPAAYLTCDVWHKFWDIEEKELVSRCVVEDVSSVKQLYTSLV